MFSAALIDGDVLVYRTAFAGQQTLYSAVPHGCRDPVVQDAENKTALLATLAAIGIPEHDVTIHKEIVLDAPANVFHSLNRQIDSIMDMSKASERRIFLTGPGNYRERLAISAPYKGHRVQDKPEYYQQVKDRLLGKFRAELCTGYEADDAMAVHGTADPRAVICSIDKDLRQVSGWHLNWTKDTEPQFISTEWGARWLFTQAIAGDSTDNIPGIPGMGTTKAAKYLMEEAPHGSTWDDLANAAHAMYTNKYPADGTDIFMEMFNLVYMCRTEEELRAQQASSKGNPGVSPWTAYPSRLDLSTVSPQD